MKKIRIKLLFLTTLVTISLCAMEREEHDNTALQKFLENGGNPNAIYQDTSDSLLSRCIKKKNYGGVKLLLIFGASQLEKSQYGYLPIHQAVNSRDLELIKILLTCPQQVPWHFSKSTRASEQRVLTFLCCQHRTRLIPRNIAIKILSYLHDDMQKLPIGSYWKHAGVNKLPLRFSLRTQKKLATKSTIESLVKKHTERHMKRLRTLLAQKADEIEEEGCYYMEGDTAYEMACRYGPRGSAELLNSYKVENLRPTIEENYRKFFSQGQSPNGENS